MPAACIKAVKAATEVPFEQGRAKEEALFRRLVASERSAALLHVFFADGAAAKIEGLPKDSPLRPTAEVVVIGAGTMGGGISMNFPSTGIPVTIVEMTKEALDRGSPPSDATMRRPQPRGGSLPTRLEARWRF